MVGAPHTSLKLYFLSIKHYFWSSYFRSVLNIPSNNNKEAFSLKQLTTKSCWMLVEKRSKDISQVPKYRTSHQRCFVEIGILKNFPKFTGKHLRQSLFCNKIAGLRSATLLKETLAQAFSYEFCEIFKNTFFHETPLVAASVANEAKS